MNRKCIWMVFIIMYGPLTAGRLMAQQATPEYLSREISFKTDNDAFLFQKKDAYYTNGFFFKLTGAIQKKEKKIIRSLELGQMIYTPISRSVNVLSDIDRPYCGYLFIALSQTKFFTGKQVLETHGSLGVVGEASFGESMQNSYHKLLRYARFTGWQYQVQNSVGIDLGVSYSKTLLEDSSWIKWAPVAQLNVGATFTNLKLGSILCVGSFENNQNSSLWNAGLQPGKTHTIRKYELFAYWFPQLILQGYNATVEGGLFSKGNGAVLGNSERWMVQHNWGICYVRERWNTKLELIYQTREATAQLNPQRYVSVQLGYRFH